jgi:release factor glutamine methyltransferase
VFFVDETVYNPSEDTFLFAENLSLEQNDAVLDMGTGCGILGILAAKKAGWVMATDLNPHAIRCAKRNATLNSKRDRMSFLIGDLFEPLGEAAKFDIVLFNAPYLPSECTRPLSWAERAWDGGASGREVIDRFIGNSRNYLKDEGRVTLLQSTYAGVEETLQKFEQLGMTTKIVAELSLPLFEKLLLIEAQFS